MLKDRPAATNPKKSRTPFYKHRLFRLLSFTLFITLFVIYVAVTFYGAHLFTSAFHRSLGPDTPAIYGLKYEDVSFATAAQDKLTLRGWWLPKPNANRTIVIVHAKDGNRAPYLPVAKELWDNNFNILMFDLRAHGTSDGEHYSFGQNEQFDVVGAVNYVKSRGFTPEHIGLLGYSMGAASSIMALRQTNDFKALVSDSAFANFEQLAKEKFTTATGLPNFLLPGIEFVSGILYGVDVNIPKPEESIKYAGQRHIYLIHGSADALVPLDHMRRLQAAGGANVVETWVVPDAYHAAGHEFQPQEYIRRVVAFFDAELK